MNVSDKGNFTGQMSNINECLCFWFPPLVDDWNSTSEINATNVCTCSVLVVRPSYSTYLNIITQLGTQKHGIHKYNKQKLMIHTVYLNRTDLQKPSEQLSVKT